MAKLKPCRDCGAEISPRATVCPRCGLEKPLQHPFAKGFKDVVKVLLSLVVLAILAVVIFEPKPVETEAERAAREAREAQERKVELAKKAEKRRRGFHCLSVWDGSHSELKSAVERQMRDPDSFEHIETRITPVSDQGTHRLFMRFRARNGFGGMSVGRVVAEIRNVGCDYEILSIDDGG